MPSDLLLQNLIFWPAVVLAIHFFYIRKNCHPDRNPWIATGLFLTTMLLPFAVAMGVVILLIDGVGLRGPLANLLAIASLLALVPGMIWSQKVIARPPGKASADSVSSEDD